MSKWFYPLQKEAEKMIDENYERVGYVNWQDVTKDRVYECWNVQRKSDNSRLTILVVMHKQTEMIQLFKWPAE